MRFEVQGMSCAHCRRAITAAVQALDPAAKVEVAIEAGTVTVASELAPELIAAAISAEGYVVGRPGASPQA